ncbi:hypothetical protein LELG_03715 [Lodderomyces elongisporus NRRL YB-4239]|uniref:Uncharacterized protein n=1 Tax=Lodderomyces elongisporus (strain ATCC 11503 / CBS 2605 / JCM 1781 / NBRC 1676 / NRRL YB-4239) TaxID=379508 RepID=A5E278_LODEL|nr:hypothetical protein LELG_03715 [Lodderomyces elongisporus NRRL YB-4239]
MWEEPFLFEFEPSPSSASSSSSLKITSIGIPISMSISISISISRSSSSSSSSSSSPLFSPTPLADCSFFDNAVAAVVVVADADVEDDADAAAGDGVNDNAAAATGAEEYGTFKFGFSKLPCDSKNECFVIPKSNIVCLLGLAKLACLVASNESASISLSGCEMWELANGSLSMLVNCALGFGLPLGDWLDSSIVPLTLLVPLALVSLLPRSFFFKLSTNFLATCS